MVVRIPKMLINVRERERERERLGRVWVEGERDGKFVEGPNPMGLLLGNEGNVRYGVMHNA